MSKGFLQVTGTLDLSQFWPSGTSDADTATVDLKGTDSFKFQKAGGASFGPTHVFDNAMVKGRQRKAPIRNGRVTIRLQGIDAPELHYQPSPLSPAEKKGASAAKLAAYHSFTHVYRQPLGASAANALSKFLTATGKSTLDCRVTTQVDTPNEVFDTYARLVGDIEVDIGGAWRNVNQWLAEQGWAFPTYYSSMTDDEIETFDKLAKAAKAQKRGIWKYLSSKVGTFDFDLREPKKNQTAVLANDTGPVLFPKLYRRFTNWSARNAAKITKLDFQNFLAGGGGTPDDCFETDDFLTNGVHSATHRTFDQFVQSGSKINFQPRDLVFKEAKSVVVGPGGAALDSF